jgi:small subunit ribosomal protein S15
VLDKERKSNVIKDNKTHPTDTGSPEVQIALLTERINDITKHFSEKKKDYHSRTGLMRLVGRRKRLLEYLKSQDINRYENLIQKLNLRK